MQKALLSNLEHEERGTRSALARLRRSKVMLQLLEDDREVVLEKARRSPLPAQIFTGSFSDNDHPGGSEYPFGVSPECFATAQLAIV